MNNLRFASAVLIGLSLAVFASCCNVARAAYLDTIGVTLLRAATTNLNGAGITVGQAEGSLSTNSPIWEVNPGVVGQPNNLFTYFYATSPYLLVSTANTFPNSLGSESSHADIVALRFYGLTNGVATNVAHVNNYEADTFVNYYVNPGRPIPERIVNQSFSFGIYDTSIDQIYDNYAAQNEVLFVSGAGVPNQPVHSPATCYNGIGVGTAAHDTPTGPTPDGRSKPDLIAPDYSETSYTTPQVAGAAALLMQAGLRGDGGSATNLAVDIRTLKALLLNGAIKPVDWTNSPSAPLHPRYGAGMLNVLNSYYQLTGGKRSYIGSASVATSNPHPPTGATGTISVLSGWDFNTNNSGKFPTQFDTANHYYFDVTNDRPGSTFITTATLVWNRKSGQTAINDLDLFLYNCANSNRVAWSTSLVDNVEHIYLTNLAQGRYDLQVWKAGGSGIVSAAEPYAIAFAFTSPALTVAGSGTSVLITWPIYPAGFRVEATTDLSAPGWSINNLPVPTFTNNMNSLSLNATDASRFFRLRQPDF